MEIALSQAKPTPCFGEYESMESMFAILAQSSNIINLNETCLTCVRQCTGVVSLRADALAMQSLGFTVLGWACDFLIFSGFHMGVLKLGSPKPWVSMQSE